MLIRSDDEILTATLGNRDGNDFLVKHAGVDSGFRALLASQGKRVLILARDQETVGDILRRLSHRIDAVLLLDRLVNEAPAEGCVIKLGITTVRCALFRQNERRTRHGLHAAGYTECNCAGANSIGDIADSIHAGTAQPVDGHGGHRYRQAGQQHGHARYVAIVFPCLVGAAVGKVLDLHGVEIFITLEQGRDWNCREIVGTHRGQRPSVAADGRPNRITDKRISHTVSWLSSWSYLRPKKMPAPAQIPATTAATRAIPAVPIASVVVRNV